MPNHLSFNQVGSSLTPAATGSPNVNLSWQLTLQRTWENIIRGGKDSDQKIGSSCPEMPPPCDIFLNDTSRENCPNTKDHTFSAVMPSLPETLRWLRECVQKNHSLRIQVLVTGSLHLIGDVLRMLKKCP